VATGPRPVTPPPVTTVRKQTKSKPKPPPATTVTDSFAGVVVNGDVWHQSSEGSGWQLTEQAGHLEFSFGASTAPGPDGGFGERLITNCVFPGDFDAEVDYNLTTWPAASGVEVLLEAQFPTAPARIARLSAQSGEAFSASLGGQPTTVEVQENSGSLRLTRRDQVVTVSFRHNGQWQTLSSGTSPETAAIAIGVDAAPGVAFGDQPVVADLDNFKVSGRSARC